MQAALDRGQNDVQWTGDLSAAGPSEYGWLREPGLLTERLRGACAGRPGLRVIGEAAVALSAGDAALLGTADSRGWVREVELLCDGRAWVFAQTLVPQRTLEHHPWLAQLGDSALGARLAATQDMTRGPLEFARLDPGAPLHRRALREPGPQAPSLWARRSWFALDGDRLLVQEVFLPACLA